MEIGINEIVEISKYEIPNNYEAIRKLGKGGYGRVFEVLEKSTKKKYAMKIIKKNSKKIYKYDTVKDEVNILKNLSHPNIIKFFDFKETVSKLFIIMELAQGESLFELISKNNNNDDVNNILNNESKIYVIIKQLLLAINYLHSHNICHRDIKPQNILLQKKGDINNIKLIDFGLSVTNFQNIGENKICGTWAYMSPEMLFNHKYYKPIDLWGVGIVMYELLNNGQHPFYKKGMTKKELLRNIRDKNLTYIDNISPLANNLLQQLLQKDLSKRITSSLALKHPWITRNESDPIPLNLYQQVNKIIIKNKMKNLLLISIFMNYMSNKSKNEINFSNNYAKTNKNIYSYQKNSRNGLISSFDFTTKVPYYKSTSSHHITKYKIFTNLKVFSNNIIESNKNGNSENNSLNLKINKIKPNFVENYSLISRNKNTFLPKISSHKSINKKILNIYNNTHEKFNINNSLKNLDTYKKNLFRNKSNWGSRNVNFIKHINNNRCYLK